MSANDFFTESPHVSPCNCFDSFSTRLDEPSFALTFGSIFFFWDLRLRVNKFNLVSLGN